MASPAPFTTHGRKPGLPKERVRIDVDLGIKGHEPALAGDDQRVDLDQARVALDVETIERLRDAREFLDLRTAQAQAECEPPALIALQSGRRMDTDTDDALRRPRRDFLDIHAACG